MPRNPPPELKLLSCDFEHHIAEYLGAIRHPVREYKVLPGAVKTGVDGEYEIDVMVTFSVNGFDYVTLIECKGGAQPIEREDVQVLADKVRSLRAHKGVVFTTSKFRKGAIEYAMARSIGLVRVAPKSFIYETKSAVPYETKALLSEHFHSSESENKSSA